MDIPTPPAPPSATTVLSNKPGGRWPKVIGLISILFGAGGLLQAVIGPVSLAFTRTQMNSYTELGVSQEVVDDFLGNLERITYTGAAGAAVLGIILLAGGILILRRKTMGALTLQGWALLKILVGGFLLFQSAGLSRQQMEIIMGPTVGGGSEAELVGTITEYATWFGFAFGFAWLLALPVFFLIWFNRASVKRDIETW